MSALFVFSNVYSIYHGLRSEQQFNRVLTKYYSINQFMTVFSDSPVLFEEYIEEKYGFKVHTAYIAEVKRNLGLPMYDAPNMEEELKQLRRHPTAEKVEAIKDALKHFGVI